MRLVLELRPFFESSEFVGHGAYGATRQAFGLSCFKQTLAEDIGKQGLGLRVQGLGV